MKGKNGVSELEPQEIELIDLARQRLMAYIRSARGAVSSADPDADYSQRELANKFGLNVNSFRSYEAGEVDPLAIHATTMKRLAMIKGWDEFSFRRYLYTGEEPKIQGPLVEEWLTYAQSVPIEVAARANKLFCERVLVLARGNREPSNNNPLLDYLREWQKNVGCSNELLAMQVPEFSLKAAESGDYIPNDAIVALAAFMKADLNELIRLRDNHPDAPLLETSLPALLAS